MYIRQNTVKQRLGSSERSFGELGQMYAQFKVSPGYAIKQDPNSIDTGYYLVNSRGQQCSAKYNIAQIRSGGIKDYQGVVGLTWAGTASAPSPAQPTPSSAAAAPLSPSSAPTVSVMPTPVSTGPSAGEVLTGVGSILSAFAAPAASIFQTQAEAKIARATLRQQQQVPIYAGPAQPQIIQQGPSAGLILGVAGGFAAIALVLVLVLKK